MHLHGYSSSWPSWALLGLLGGRTGVFRSRARYRGLPGSSAQTYSGCTLCEEAAMPEEVIVATARSPIGRAGKGSLASIRPDDLTAQIVAAALAKVPPLDPADVGDLI